MPYANLKSGGRAGIGAFLRPQAPQTGTGKLDFTFLHLFRGADHFANHKAKAASVIVREQLAYFRHPPCYASGSALGIDEHHGRQLWVLALLAQ